MEQYYYLQVPEPINDRFIKNVNTAIIKILNGLNAKMINNNTSEDDVIMFCGDLGGILHQIMDKSIFDRYKFKPMILKSLDDQIQIIKTYNAHHVDDLLNMVIPDGYTRDTKLNLLKEFKTCSVKIKLEKVPDDKPNKPMFDKNNKL